MVQRCMDQVRGRSLAVVLPEGNDERILAAARRLKDEALAEPIVLGKADEVEAAASSSGVRLEGIDVVDPTQSGRLQAYVEAYSGNRNLDVPIARQVVKRPLYYAGMMVAQGDAQTMVAGVSRPTARVIQAGVLTVGLGEGIATPSSFFLMILPEFQGAKNRSFVYADCAVNIAPTAAQLADIAIASERSARQLLGEEPRVAMLSFSTKGSASHASVERVAEALKIVKQKAPHVQIDGEFQADTAIIPAVGAKKVPGPSAVAGRANVLIFPDLNSGNIAYKLTQYMAGARAIGPFLQGFAKPISDLSRGASVDDVVASAAVCLAQAVSDGR